MKRRQIAFVALALLVAACSPATSTATTPSEVSTPTTELAQSSTTSTRLTVDPGFPVTVNIGGVDVTVDDPPMRIVSLSATATETLFAIGAGDQVVAVDEFSDYPVEAPTTSLSGFTPNIEAIASFDPDLIVIAFDPDNLITSAFSPDVPVVVQFPATSRADLLTQMEQLGELTGHTDTATALTDDIVARWDIANEADAGGASVYIEIDTTFYSSSSNSFMGGALVDLGYTNIADPADVDGFGFPQLSAESIISANPDVIIIGTDSGVSPDDIASRPGWNTINAVANERVIVIDSDISSRWGPRFVEYIESMAALAESVLAIDY